MHKATFSITRFAGAVLASAAFLGVSPLSSVFVPGAYAQNAVTGALTGVVADNTGAVIPGAKVTIIDASTRATLTVTTDASGRYTAPLLKPSTYQVSAAANGLQSNAGTIAVLVGQTPSLNLTATPSGSSENVTVSAQTAQLTDTQSPALITTLTEKQIQELPAPGGDITTVAFTAPGVVLNSGGSYGNFSADGIPGTSNLYVLNGYDDVDPFLNLSSSGSSNLSLGQGEVSEASVVQNGYGVQYGRAAGVVINYTTKSGSNGLHGEANYFYNGSVLNANDWFLKNQGLPRPKAISNQWAANAGGPIVKDKLFFFADYEGLRYVLPASGPATFPTVPFQNAVLGRIPASDLPFYQQAFKLYNGSPSLANAHPITAAQDPQLGCGSAAALNIPDGAGGTFGTTSPCASYGFGRASNLNTEWLFTARADWNISDKQKLFGRYKMDRGSQPTYTNFISPVFNTISTQPEYEGQLNDTYVVSPHLTNQFIFAANWYTAYFGPINTAATLATFPTYLTFNDGGYNGSTGVGVLGLPNGYINGRNVTQYQFVDDLSYVRGNNTFRFGYNFRRDDISDYDAQQQFAGIYSLQMSDFANGTLAAGSGSSYFQSFTSNKTAYLALYNLGAYVEDEWQADPRLKLTAGLRFDRTGNPLATNNAFATYNGAFPRAAATNDTPYNSLIASGQEHPFNSVQSINVQPRIGFNYDVNGDGRTVVRGGFGLFSDLYPAGFLDGYIQNFPNVYGATLTTGNVAQAGVAGSAPTGAIGSFNQLESSFASGATYNTTNAALAGNFTAPNFTTAPKEFKNPTYAEYNLQIQRQVSKSDALIFGYVGNVGYDEIVENRDLNGASATRFGGLPTTSPDPNFNTVQKYYNGSHSNYNGATVTWKHIDSRGFTADVTYVYSKALDDISNGGTGEYYNAGDITTQIDPFDLHRLNYSYADYDFRHSVTLDFVYDTPFHFKNLLVNEAAGGWSLSGKSFWRTGQPFSVFNGALPFQAGGSTLSNTALADSIDLRMGKHCNGSVAVNPCFTQGQFADSASGVAQADFGNLPRNSFFGPHYADTDLSLYKKFVLRETANLQLGVTAFNVWNHPNFQLPSGNVNSPGLGLSSAIAAPPTSPYGSFQQAGIGGRVAQVFGKITF